ncbi:MAG TPA: KH domain-containing protein [Patescibacteria group bacterium]
MDEKAKKLLTELFTLIGIKAEFEVSVEEPKDEEKVVNVKIDSKEESGLLIGSHGSTLEALQYFLGLALKNETGEWARVNVDIANWKEKQNDHLISLAQHTAESAIRKGEPQYLYNLTPGQRRIVHMELANNTEVETKSEGEGEERYLVVQPKGK